MQTQIYLFIYLIKYVSPQTPHFLNRYGPLLMVIDPFN